MLCSSIPSLVSYAVAAALQRGMVVAREHGASKAMLYAVEEGRL